MKTLIEANFVHQTEADSDKAAIKTHDAQGDSNTNEIKLVINNDVIILHEDTDSRKSNDPLMFKSTNVTQLFKSYPSSAEWSLNIKLFPLNHTFTNWLPTNTHA